MDTIERIKRMVRHYAPEWTFDGRNTEPGAVFAAAFASVMDESCGLFDKLLDKHYYAFLNYMGVEPPPPQSAEGFAVFSLAKGAPRGEIVQDGAILCDAETDAVYTVKDGVYVTSSTLEDSYLCGSDCIYGAYMPDGSIKLDASSRSLQQHELIILHDRAFEEIGAGGSLELDLGVDLGEDITGALSWEYVGNGTAEKFSEVKYSGNIVTLSADGKALKNGTHLRAVLRSMPDGVDSVSVKHFKIAVISGNATAVRVFHRETELDPAKFDPFGKTLSPGDCFYCACNEAFSKKSSCITISFNLSFAKIVPGGEITDEIKDADPVKIAGYAVEYWNGADFTTLKDYTWKCENGQYKFSFYCPGDMEPLLMNGISARWIQVRITEVTTVYKSLSFYIPQTGGLTVTYQARNFAPLSVTVTNNLETATFPGSVEGLKVFKKFQYSKPNLFLGFDQAFGGQPLCFLAVPGKAARASKLNFYALTGAGGVWEPLTVVDNTGGFGTAGLITLYFDDQPKPSDLFGKELVWLRAEFGDGKFPEPRELKIWMNAAAITQKTPWLKEFFTVSSNDADSDGVVRIELKERNITDVRVFVNGADCLDFKLDSYNGVLILNVQGVLSAVADVAVEYRSSLGAAGNRPENKVTRMAASAGYVQSVTNPLPLTGGWSFDEANPGSSARKLRHNDRATTAGDYEALAREFAGALLKCRCLGAKTAEKDAVSDQSGCVKLVYLPEDYPRKYPYAARHTEVISKKLREYLLERCPPILHETGRLTVCEANYRALAVNAKVTVASSDTVITAQKETEKALDAFLDPVTGNFDGGGFDFGEIPDKDLIKWFLYSLPFVNDISDFEINVDNADSDDRLSICIPGNHSIIIAYK